MAFELPVNVENLTPDDLRRLTNALIDDVLHMLRHCADADVTFVPIDPAANDTFASSEDEVGIAWTLGHVIVRSGDAGGVQATVNGADRGVLGRNGWPLTVAITPTGIEPLTPTRPEP